MTSEGQGVQGLALRAVLQLLLEAGRGLQGCLVSPLLGEESRTRCVAARCSQGGAPCPARPQAQPVTLESDSGSVRPGRVAVVEITAA